MQQSFLLQILLLAQHVSGTTMSIIRSSRVLYSGCCLYNILPQNVPGRIIEGITKPVMLKGT